jgi:hypothetical protein
MTDEEERILNAAENSFSKNSGSNTPVSALPFLLALQGVVHFEQVIEDIEGVEQCQSSHIGRR